MNVFSLLFAIITFFSTLVGGILAAKYRKDIGTLTAFAAGVLIAVPLLDLLPETFKLAVDANVSINDVMYLTVLGFILLFVLDRYLSLHNPGDSKKQSYKRQKRGGVFATSQLTAHSFVDGLAIGFTFQFEFEAGLIVAVAVICHDFADGMSTFTVMLNSGNSMRNSIRMVFLDAVAPVVGAIISLFIQVPQYYIVLLLPFFAGGFLYLGASDLLPEAHQLSPQLKTIFASLMGFLVIFILARILNV